MTLPMFVTTAYKLTGCCIIFDGKLIVREQINGAVVYI